MMTYCYLIAPLLRYIILGQIITKAEHTLDRRLLRVWRRWVVLDNMADLLDCILAHSTHTPLMLCS